MKTDTQTDLTVSHSPQMTCDEQSLRLDAHCHPELFSRPDAVIKGSFRKKLHIFAMGTQPRHFMKLQAKYEKLSGGFCSYGLGLHPWWIDDGRASAQDIELFFELIEKSRNIPIIGEVGLDASGTPERHQWQLQQAIFERLCKTLAELDSRDQRFISLHANKAASPLLDLLERYQIAQKHICVLHWFSGSCGELIRARELGCWFSVNSFMLQKPRGQEYLKLIPSNRLLLETDFPPKNFNKAQIDPQNLHEDYEINSIYEALLDAEKLVAQIEKPERSLLKSIANNTTFILELIHRSSLALK